MKKIINLLYKKGKINKISIGIVSIILIFAVILSYFGVIAIQNSRVAGSWVTENESPQQWTFDIFGGLRIYEYPMQDCNQGCGYSESTYKINGDSIIFNDAVVHFKITTDNKTCMTMTSDSKGAFVGTMCRLQ